MRILFAIAVCLLLQSCAVLEPDQDWNNFQRNYAASINIDVMDRAIEKEVRREVPSGIRANTYSPDDWNIYWNRRINFLFDLGHNEVDKAYRGPSGPELIRRLIEKRREKGLPELVIEERNRGKVP